MAENLSGKKFNVYPVLRDTLLTVTLALLILGLLHIEVWFFQRLSWLMLGIFYGVFLYSNILVSLWKKLDGWRRPIVATVFFAGILGLFMSGLTKVFYSKTSEIGSVMPVSEFLGGFAWLLVACVILNAVVITLLHKTRVEILCEPVHMRRWSWVTVIIATSFLVFVSYQVAKPQ
jgi:hypothetical protein